MSNRRRPPPRRAATEARPEPTTGHGDIAASLVLIFPLLLAYEIGVLFAGRVNGADLVTRAVYATVGGKVAYLLVHVVFAVAFLVWIRRGRRWATLTLEHAAPVILEAAIYALTLGAVGALIVDKLLGLGLGGSVVSALGAGVHEELVFRLGMMAGGVALLTRCGVERRLAVVLALIGSCLVFAAAHHLGSHGEPWTVGSSRVDLQACKLEYSIVSPK